MLQGFLPNSQIDIIRIWATPAFALTAATDIVVTLFMCLTLQRRKSGIDQTDTTVNKIILNTINNGLLTSVIALLGLVFQTTMQESYAATAMCALLGKGE
jgi:hypothetical protein